MGGILGTRRARLRASAAVAVAGTVVLGAGISGAQVPASDTGLISACFNRSAGSLKVIDYQGGARCGTNEQLLEWKSGNGALADGSVRGGQGGVIADGTVDQYDIKDGSIGAAELDTDTKGRISALEDGLQNEAVTRAAADSSLQSALDGEAGARAAGDSALQSALDLEAAARQGGDSALQATLGQLQTGLSNEAAARQAADLALETVTFSRIAPGAVRGTGSFDPSTQTPSSGNIALKSITHDNIAESTVRGGTDGSVSNEIEDGTVTADDLAPGTIRADRIAGGAVTTDKTQANTTLVMNSADTSVPANLSLAPVTSAGALVVSGAANHRVSFTGQLGLSCSSCAPIGTIVQYALFVDNAPTGLLYTTSISQTQPFVVVPITWMDDLPPGAHTFDVRAAANAPGINVITDAVGAIDLGRA